MLGPRKIPSSEDLEQGRIRLPETVKFTVDTEKQTVAIDGDASTNVDIGSTLAYFVSP